MNRILHLVFHPHVQDSNLHQQWIQRLTPQVTTSRTFRDTQDFIFEREENDLNAHTALLLQFPVFWYSCPTCMKYWIDHVTLLKNKENYKGKHVIFLVSSGSKKNEYTEQGRHKYSLEEFFLPLNMTFQTLNMTYIPAVVLYGIPQTSEDVDQYADIAISRLHHALDCLKA